MRKLTQEEFIAQVKKLHGDRYILDRVQYKGTYEKITVGCRKHGYYSVVAKTFKQGHNIYLWNTITPKCTWYDEKASLN